MLTQRFKIALLFGALVVLFSTAAPAPASAAIKLGVFNSGAPQSATANSDFTALIGRQPDLVLFYHDFGHSLITSEEAATLNATGQTPMVTWEPHSQSLSSIAAGTHDSYLRKSAQTAKAFGRELMVRFAHEMNGTWYSWARSSSYVAAWQHIVSVFREEGATNVRWVWAPNVDRTGSMPFAPYFPGDEWVDYIGLDGYNWGATPGNTWASFEQVFSASYAKITTLSTRPLIITETASSEVGGDKAEWIRTGFTETVPQKFPRITGVIWFNKIQEDNWPIVSSAAALEAYREVANCSMYGGSGSCGATTTTAPVPDPVVVESVTVTPVVEEPVSQPTGTVTYKVKGKGKKVRLQLQHRTRGGRWARRGSMTRRAHSGRNRVPLKRLVRKRKLRRGHYRVTITAYGDEGRRSRPRKDRFRVS